MILKEKIPNKIELLREKLPLLDKILNFKYLFEIFIFSLYFIYLLVLRWQISIYLFGPKDPSDWYFYYHMASDITSIFKSEIIIPFCYRPLIPFLVGLLPFSIHINFMLINFICYILLGIMLYCTLRIFFNKQISAIGLLLLCYISFLQTTDFQIINSYFYFNNLIDPAGFLFLILGFYTIFKKNKKAYAITLFIGVLVKENIIFTIPVFLIYEIFENAENKRKFKDFFQKDNFIPIIKEILSLSKYFIPALILYFVFKFFVIPAPNSAFPWWEEYFDGKELYSIESMIMHLFYHIDEVSVGFGLMFYTFGIWGPITIVLCLFNKFEVYVKFLKIYGIFFCCVLLQFLFGNGKSRFAYVALFPVIFLALSGLQNISKDKPLILWVFVLILFTTISYRFTVLFNIRLKIMSMFLQ